MTYSHEVEHMCVVKKGPNHGPAPIPEEGKWVKSKEIVDISGLTHGIGWCAPQQGACKLTLNVTFHYLFTVFQVQHFYFRPYQVNVRRNNVESVDVGGINCFPYIGFVDP